MLLPPLRARRRRTEPSTAIRCSHRGGHRWTASFSRSSPSTSPWDASRKRTTKTKVRVRTRRGRTMRKLDSFHWGATGVVLATMCAAYIFNRDLIIPACQSGFRGLHLTVVLISSLVSWGQPSVLRTKAPQVQSLPNLTGCNFLTCCIQVLHANSFLFTAHFQLDVRDQLVFPPHLKEGNENNEWQHSVGVEEVVFNSHNSSKQFFSFFATLHMCNNRWSHYSVVWKTHTIYAHRRTETHFFVYIKASSLSSLLIAIALSQVERLQDAAPGLEFLHLDVLTGSTNPARPRRPRPNPWCPWVPSPRGRAGRASSRPACSPLVSPRWAGTLVNTDYTAGVDVFVLLQYIVIMQLYGCLLEEQEEEEWHTVLQCSLCQAESLHIENRT